MINRKKYKEFDKYEKFKRFELTAFFLLCLLMPLHEVAAAKGSSTSGLVAEVQRLNDIGDFEAVSQMKMLHPELSQSAQAMECFAFSDQDLHNMKNAMAEFSAAERLAPNDLHVQTSFVYGLYGMGLHQEALFRINKIVAAHPRDARCRAIQALVLQQTASAKESLAALKEAEKLEMSFPVWEAKYNYAIGDLNQKQTIQTADDCLKAFPNSIQVRMFHGKAMRNAGRMAAAASDFQKVLKTNPNHMSALTLLAEVYQMDRKYKQAIECSERRVKLVRTPHEMRVVNRALAEIYEKDNNLPAAVVARERMIAGCLERKKCRNEWEMNDILMCCRDLVALKRWNEAVVRLSLVIDRYPECVEALEKRSQCYTSLNRNADAIKDYSRLIRVHNDVASWYRQRAILLKRAGRAQEAESDLKRAQALDASQRSDENL